MARRQKESKEQTYHRKKLVLQKWLQTDYAEMRAYAENKIRRLSTGCWKWGDGEKLVRPVATFRKGHRCTASLFVWCVWKRRIHDKPMLCHTCDNVWCVRPKHLFPGTMADNMQDCAEKGRTRGGAKRRSCDSPLSKLTWKQLRQVRGAYCLGEPVKEIGKRFGITPVTVWYRCRDLVFGRGGKRKAQALRV